MTPYEQNILIHFSFCIGSSLSFKSSWVMTLTLSRVFNWRSGWSGRLSIFWLALRGVIFLLCVWFVLYQLTIVSLVESCKVFEYLTLQIAPAKLSLNAIFIIFSRIIQCSRSVDLDDILHARWIIVHTLSNQTKGLCSIGWMACVSRFLPKVSKHFWLNPQIRCGPMGPHKVDSVTPRVYVLLSHGTPRRSNTPMFVRPGNRTRSRFAVEYSSNESSPLDQRRAPDSGDDGITPSRSWILPGSNRQGVSSIEIPTPFLPRSGKSRRIFVLKSRHSFPSPFLSFVFFRLKRWTHHVEPQ